MRHSLNAAKQKSASAWYVSDVSLPLLHACTYTHSQNQVFPDGCLGLWEWKFIYVRFCMAVLMSIRRVKQLCGWKSCSAMLILITHVKIYIERESAETLFAFYGSRRLWMELFNTKFHNVVERTWLIFRFLQITGRKMPLPKVTFVQAFSENILLEAYIKGELHAEF